MRILVGTLYTIENEFDDCCKSIRNQTYKNYDHLIIKNLPKKEAHDTLYQTFVDKSDEYDLLVKIDADMVLCRNDLFDRIVEKFTHETELDLLLIAVHDFFTDGPVIGMNVFRKTVRWEKNKNDLITDRAYLPETIRRKEKDYDTLAPAALHCPNPSPYQSFHFGFHRGMKAFRGGGNWRIVQGLFNHYRDNPDPLLAFAMLGINTAFTGRFSVDNISYNDKTLYDYFNNKYNSNNNRYLHRSVRRSNIFWFFNAKIDKSILLRYYQLKSRIFQRKVFSGK
jgi:hypothetical protein